MALDLTIGAQPGLGCPSGLAPALGAEHPAPDPQPFVRQDSKGRDALDLAIKGARCAGCIKKIEGGLLSLPGVEDARLNLSTGRLSVAWRAQAQDARTILQKVLDLGFEAAPFDPAAAAKEVDAAGRSLLLRLGVAAFGMMNVMMFSVPIWAGHGEMGEATRTWLHWISALIAIPAALYAAQPFFQSALAALRKGRANMDVPISLGVVLTLAVSIAETAQKAQHAFFDSVLMLLFFLLIGRYLDHRLRERARTAARELLALQAVTAQRFTADDRLELVSARDIAPGDRLMIAAGDRIPVDSRIESGVSDIDRSVLTGESAPVEARAGDLVHSGMTNLTRALIVRAQARADQSLAAELARLIEAGEQRRDGQMRLADRAARAYVPIVHSLAALTFLGWIFLPQWIPAIPDIGVRGALLNAVAVLIITCPCALGLAVPAVQVTASGRLFQRGVFVRSGDALERLAQIDAVALDKTGTLTLGQPVLVDADDAAPQTLADAATLARASRHPLSRALALAAGPGPLAENVRELPGDGLIGQIHGLEARLGRYGFVAADAAAPPPSGDGPEIWFRHADGAPVRFRFEDALRPDAAPTMAEFQRRGLDPILVSGDAPRAVAAAARAAGLTRFEGALSPQDKITRLEALRAQGKRVLMIGDGLNDAAALAAAHASASPGSAVEAAQAAADIVVRGPFMAPILEAIDIAKAARARAVENLALSALYNLIAVPIAVLGLVTPLIAAIAMAGSSLIVTLNALRLQFSPRLSS